jgi:hypothetical protein
MDFFKINFNFYYENILFHSHAGKSIKSVAHSQVSGRTSVLTGSNTSRPETVSRIAVDEIEALLKQKLKGAGHNHLKTAWKNNDVEGKGWINRDVIKNVLSKFLNREISSRQIELLLQTWD